MIKQYQLNIENKTLDYLQPIYTNDNNIQILEDFLHNLVYTIK